MRARRLEEILSRGREINERYEAMNDAMSAASISSVSSVTSTASSTSQGTSRRVRIVVPGQDSPLSQAQTLRQPAAVRPQLGIVFANIRNEFGTVVGTIAPPTTPQDRLTEELTQRVVVKLGPIVDAYVDAYGYSAQWIEHAHSTRILSEDAVTWCNLMAPRLSVMEAAFLFPLITSSPQPQYRERTLRATFAEHADRLQG